MRRGVSGLLVLFAVICLVVAAETVYLLINKAKSSSTSTAIKQPPKSDAIIAKVGSENIWQKDLDYEISMYPVQGKNIEEVRKLLLAKIVRDSIILQGGKTEKLATVGASIFNVSGKDYIKRFQTVQEIEEKVRTNADAIEGTLVALFIFNTDFGRLGYTKSKELVTPKAKQLYDEVKSKKITIDQAAERIRDDSSLAGADPNYKGNSILKFKARKGEKITLFPDFDQELFRLKSGEISSLYLGKDKDPKTGKMIDATYVFGQVTKQFSSSGKLSFDDWFNKYKKQYEVTYY